MFIVIFLLFLPTRKSSCSTTNPMYLACNEPKRCGNGINITFPFYIQGQQDAACGYPGFELTCNSKGNPILTISKNNYIVQKISNQNQTLHLLNDGWFGPKGMGSDSIRPIRNLSLPDERFQYAGNAGKLLLFYNCSTVLATGNVYYYWKTDNYSTVLAVFENDPNMDSVTTYCNNLVIAPVNMYGGGRDYNISEVITRGFDLKWSTAGDCGACVQSGGRCGFDISMYRFQCFCPDMPHALSCLAPAPGILF